MDMISNLWANWPGPLRLFMDLFVLYYLVKGVAVRQIDKEVHKRQAWFIQIFKKIFMRNPRTVSIWEHERDQALKKGHTLNLLDCQEGMCSTF